MIFMNTPAEFTLSVTNGVMNYTFGTQNKQADATVTMNRSLLDDINLKQANLAEAITRGHVTIDGNQEKVTEFIGLIDNFDFWFNIVTL
ncbi:MAG: alkyl sulfatase C-terminal domain-containing protein [Xanthobacter sp.]